MASSINKLKHVALQSMFPLLWAVLVYSRPVISNDNEGLSFNLDSALGFWHCHVFKDSFHPQE